MNDHGRMAVVLPNGVFFRTGAEFEVRRELVDDDLVEAVIQLPNDMFYGAGIPACYLVINRAKRSERLRKVLFVDASECFDRIDTKNVMNDDHVERIGLAFETFAEEPGFAAVVDKSALLERKYNLAVRRYVKGTLSDDFDAPSLREACVAYRSSRAAREAAEVDAQIVLAALEETDD
jgi:type I restriction enzyme M protein